ncbi:extracellular solute-binding protein [Pelagerythrobacter aerophilus]|uniref:Extracellular solute-binding protein n=1 Tax=Pelagerythrobacter aerophilus TaxID=2306995 RepID=A0A418NEW6_9SPHN|nr:extracellular solute-binding protein [Pelagerythrobacter aerophilus]RIV76895.1 extracellular solute-binding protein [Pelagerythrobacter aerophilus]
MTDSLSRRDVLAAGIAGSAALALGGCRGDAGLTFWAIGNEATALPALLPKLGLGGIDVQPLPWSGAHQKLLTGFVGRSLPDLAQVGNSWLAELAALDAIEPVPAALDPEADQFSAVIESNRINGRLVAMPWYVDTRVQFYRTDIFARAGYATPPLDWSGWKRALARIRAQSAGETYGVLLPLDEFEHLQTLALSAGATFLKENGTRGAFTAPEFIEGLAFYKSLFDEGLAPVVAGAQIGNRWAEFARGWFAVYPAGPWMIGEMRSRLPVAMQDLWSTAPHPGPGGPGATATGGSSLVVFSRGRRKREAWEVVRRMLDPAAQLALHRATGDLPVRRSVWRETELAGDRVVAPFAHQLERAQPLPKVPEWERVVTEMQVVADRMVRGDYTVRSAAAEMDLRVDEILAKRRWMMERGRLA